VQADVHKDALVESVVMRYLRVCDFGMLRAESWQIKRLIERSEN
jgi:hypothetical protein